MAKWKQIRSIEELKQLANDVLLECAIILNGGAYSRKYVSFNPDDSKFYVTHCIDDAEAEYTVEELATQTNFIEAMEKGAFVVDEEAVAERYEAPDDTPEEQIKEPIECDDNNPKDKVVRIVVACLNAEGEPDFYFLLVNDDRKGEEVDDWDCIEQTAIAQAKDEGYEGPFIVYDCDSYSAGRKIAECFEWKSLDEWAYMIRPEFRQPVQKVDHIVVFQKIRVGAEIEFLKDGGVFYKKGDRGEVVDLFNEKNIYVKRNGFSRIAVCINDIRLIEEEVPAVEPAKRDELVAQVATDKTGKTVIPQGGVQYPVAKKKKRPVYVGWEIACKCGSHNAYPDPISPHDDYHCPDCGHTGLSDEFEPIKQLRMEEDDE